MRERPFQHLKTDSPKTVRSRFKSGHLRQFTHSADVPDAHGHRPRYRSPLCSTCRANGLDRSSDTECGDEGCGLAAVLTGRLVHYQTASARYAR